MKLPFLAVIALAGIFLAVYCARGLEGGSQLGFTIAVIAGGILIPFLVQHYLPTYTKGKRFIAWVGVLATGLLLMGVYRYYGETVFMNFFNWKWLLITGAGALILGVIFIRGRQWLKDKNRI